MDGVQIYTAGLSVAFILMMSAAVKNTGHFGAGVFTVLLFAPPFLRVWGVW